MEITVYPKYLVRRLLAKGNKSFFSAGYALLYPQYNRHGMTPWQHYVVDGRRNGYDDGNHPPLDIFFPEGYLAMYPDVAALGEDPWHHYVLTGKKEGRDNGLHPDENTFFSEGYLEMYPDVAAAGIDPWRHYVQSGKKEGRDSGLHPDENTFFSEGYLEMYPDVSETGTDPWHHYVLTGKKEGRDNGLHPDGHLFSADDYLWRYPDVAIANLNPWRHYLLAGRQEGRTARPDARCIGKDLQKKAKIRVLFILTNLPKWKTEPLYQAMLAHERFVPMIGVAARITEFPSEIINEIQTLENYLKSKKYDFIELSHGRDIEEKFDPDIVFYQEAGECNNSLSINELRHALSCYVPYCLVTTPDFILDNNDLQNLSWQYYVDFETTLDNAKSLMTNHGRNLYYTGSPVADELILEKSHFSDPWKKQDIQGKKRIIWAPHHTIGVSYDAGHSGNFLKYCDFMVKLAEQTKDKVQWAFKPHPVLRQKLQFLWGKTKTDAYFDKWATMGNTQLEAGEYIGLFKYSDAMIHDSYSFIIEYLYMMKPCLFMENGKDHNYNQITQKAHDLYELSYKPDDVLKFVKNVIDGVDPRKAEREQFFHDCLLPPNGRSARDNIIAAILGEPPYNKQPV